MNRYTPHATTTTQTSSLSLEPNEATTNVTKNDDKICDHEGTRRDLKPEAGLLEPHSVTDTQALSHSQGPSTAKKDDKVVQEGPKPESVGIQFPAAQSVDATQQSETTTATTQATGTVLDSYCEEQAVVEETVDCIGYDNVTF